MNNQWQTNVHVTVKTRVKKYFNINYMKTDE